MHLTSLCRQKLTLDQVRVGATTNKTLFLSNYKSRECITLRRGICKNVQKTIISRTDKQQGPSV